MSEQHLTEKDNQILDEVCAELKEEISMVMKNRQDLELLLIDTMKNLNELNSVPKSKKLKEQCQ